MKCPNCGNGVMVWDTARSEEEIYRKRKCKVCGHKFCTIEYEVDYDAKFKKEWAKNNRAWSRTQNKTKKEIKN